MSAGDREWLAAQIDQYAALVPWYDRYTVILEDVLRRAVADLAPLAIVQVRRKSVPSFAEKCLRKRAKRPNPVEQFTDLCGARVIARTRSERDAVCRYLVEHFEVDLENSLDVSKRLRPSEFGYRSVHYIVSPRSDIDYGVPIPAEVLGLRAEIQVRTITEHAYSDFAHDLTYKGAFELPLAWRRELAGAAATLEEVDGVFARVEEGLRQYASTYGRYLPEQDLAAEIELLETVLAHDPKNPALADRLARLAMVNGQWPRVVDVLSRFVEDDGAHAPLPVLRDLGTALCKVHQDAPRGADYRRGQDYLQRAAAVGDVDAICAFAGTWKGLDDDRARGLYQRAFDLDPTNPYPLGNYLELQLDREPGLIDSLRPVLRSSVQRCQDQVTAGVNLPWALFDLARFHLLLGEPYEGLETLTEAATLSTSAWMIETALASLERLTRSLPDLPGVEWSRRLLLLVLAARFDDDGARARICDLATPGVAPLQPPVLVVAGGTDPRVQAQMDTYRDLLRAALADAHGTVLSGGTTQGVCGIVGDLGHERGERLRTVGYLPLLLPTDATPDPDYDEIRQTSGHSFSVLEPLQNWTDIIAAGIAPSSVRMLGVGGGRIAAAEYRIALALGAKVGLLADSGREAGRLLGDQRWGGQGAIRLPADAETLRAFVSPPSGMLNEDTLKKLARVAHESYRRQRRTSPTFIDPALAAWEDLPEDLRASNLAQVDAIAAQAARVGCVIAPADAPGPATTLTDEEVETLAEAEHGRFVAERLQAGWTPGEVRDVARRTSPYLIEWALLEDDIREFDREAVRAYHGLLEQAGLGLRRTSPHA